MNDSMACAAASVDELLDVVDDEELTGGEPESEELELLSAETPTSANACMMLVINPPPWGGDAADPVHWVLPEASVVDCAVLLDALNCVSQVLRLEMLPMVMLVSRMLVGPDCTRTLEPVVLRIL
jgi:hypothetical protein